MAIRRILVPGLGDAGPAHWQSLWEREDPPFERVTQRDSLEPDRDEWVAAIESVVVARPGPCVLVGHSLGCGTIVHWARTGSANRCIGAFLVAPSDIEELPYRDAVATFLPLPLSPLPFPSLVVASINDPYVTPACAERFARGWESRFVDVGAAGHIWADSGHGPWPEGRDLLRRFVAERERDECGGRNVPP